MKQKNKQLLTKNWLKREDGNLVPENCFWEFGCSKLHKFAVIVYHAPKTSTTLERDASLAQTNWVKI